jgi:hypothetical protein
VSLTFTSPLDRFHAAPLKLAPYRPFHAEDGAMNRVPARRGLVLEDHAGKSLQDDLDATQLIHAAPRTVHVFYAYGDAHDGRSVLPELGGQAAIDIRLEVLIEIEAGGT